MINNEDELLEEAKKIPDIESRTKFIMNYFLEHVEYNYAYLFARGYMGENISAVSNSLVMAPNKTKTKEDSDNSLTRSILHGESRIFDDILKIRDENEGNYDEFINQLRNYITLEIKSHLNNNIIVKENVDIVMKHIEKGLREKFRLNIQGNEYDFNFDISKVLLDFFLEHSKIFPAEFKNGLITKGVCADYTEYLVPLLKKVGIEAHSAKGISELPHAWIIVKDGEKYKSVDLTRAVIIRDGFKGIPSEQTSEDWLYTNLKNMFKMQKTRKIIKIDDKELPSIITKENFDEEVFTKIMNDNNREDWTFKNITRRALGNHTTKTESLEAENAEKLNEREDRINE